MSTDVPAPALGHGPLVQSTPRDELPEAARLIVAGWARGNPHWDGVILLADRLSHWVHLSAGEVVSFQTALTSRLAEALGGGAQADGDAVEATMTRPERLAIHLRSADLSGRPQAITGHLVGAELAATRPYWLGQTVLICGAYAGRYSDALAAQGVPVSPLDATGLTAAALAALGRAN